jgi:hypothetical protein
MFFVPSLAGDSLFSPATRWHNSNTAAPPSSTLFGNSAADFVAMIFPIEQD